MRCGGVIWCEEMVVEAGGGGQVPGMYLASCDVGVTRWVRVYVCVLISSLGEILVLASLGWRCCITAYFAFSYSFVRYVAPTWLASVLECFLFV